MRFMGGVISTVVGYVGGCLGLVVFWFLGGSLANLLDLNRGNTSMIPISPLEVLMAALGCLTLMIVAVAWTTAQLRGRAKPWLGSCLGTGAGLIVWGVVSVFRGDAITGLLALPPAASLGAWLFPSQAPSGPDAKPLSGPAAAGSSRPDGEP